MYLNIKKIENTICSVFLKVQNYFNKHVSKKNHQNPKFSEIWYGTGSASDPNN